MKNPMITRKLNRRVKRPYLLWFFAIVLLFLTLVIILVQKEDPQAEVKPDKQEQTTTSMDETTTTIPGSVVVVTPDGKRIVVAPGGSIPAGSTSPNGTPIASGQTVPATSVPGTTPSATAQKRAHYEATNTSASY